MTAPNTIRLTGQFRYEEYLTESAITPGHLVELFNSSGTGKVKKHATEGGHTERAFAVEDALQGNTIDDAYASGDLVGVALADPGAEVYAYLKAGESVVPGDELISAGDGTLIKNGSEASGTTVEQVVATALEVLDLSDSGDTATRLRVRVR